MDSNDEAQIAFQKLTSGDYECAESLYAKLLEKDKQNTEYLAHKAECDFKLSKFQTCLDDVKYLHRILIWKDHVSNDKNLENRVKQTLTRRAMSCNE